MPVNTRMENHTQSAEQTELQARFHRVNGARILWKCLAIFCVAAWLLYQCQPHIRYVFHIYDDQIDLIKSQWFHRDKTVSVTWRKDSDGELGWCAKGKDGHWHKFISEPPDDYAN